jgi:hypothetical protein
MKFCPAQNLLDQLDGATISASFVEDNEGLHVCLQDGRILVVAGYFALSIIKSVEKLH